MTSSLVIGASRGLGRGFVEQLLAREGQVLATVRREEDAEVLHALAEAAEAGDRLETFFCDVADPESRAGLAAALEGRAIHTLIHNAGVYGPRAPQLGELPEADWQQVLHIDTVAPVLTAEALLPQLRAAAQQGGPVKLAFLTSLMGSIADNGSGGSYLYRSAKAGLNAAARSLSIDLAPDGISVLLLHPGWVQTDMGGSSAPLQIEESVAGMLARIEALRPADSGSFVDWSGKSLPW
ncbi:MAG: short-chain dehydrogenase [Planctomycetes bacterium]|nr:short-chain dehydrogenase [Planctomycetota bacterium]